MSNFFTVNIVLFWWFTLIFEYHTPVAQTISPIRGYEALNKEMSQFCECYSIDYTSPTMRRISVAHLVTAGQHCGHMSSYYWNHFTTLTTRISTKYWPRSGILLSRYPIDDLETTSHNSRECTLWDYYAGYRRELWCQTRIAAHVPAIKHCNR